jgi:hypothetical protein
MHADIEIQSAAMAVRVVRAAPTGLLRAIFLMNAGTSMPEGQAVMHGAPKL